MAKTKISEFSSTPANNTDIDSINIAEGCAPSNINDAIRELMAQLKDFQTGAVGDSFNGPIGSSTASTGAFTNITASGTLGVTGVATLGAGAILNTPASVTLTNATGLPISTGVSGLGTGVATALAVNVGSAGAPVVNGGALGTPSSGTVTNLTGTASININGTVGATTPTTGAFTTVNNSGGVRFNTSGTEYARMQLNSTSLELMAGSTSTAGITLNSSNVATLTNNPVLTAGTANGVTYLNGSKVLTSGSALTFDGTNLGVGANITASAASAPSFTVGTGSGSPAITLYSATTGSSQISFADATSGGGAYDGYVLYNQNSQYMAFGIASSEQMRLTSTGLKVGTTSDFSSAKVVTDGGGIGILNKGLLRSSTNGVLQVSADPNNAYASSQISFDVDGSTAMTLDASGYLMVGTTTSNSAKLTIANAGAEVFQFYPGIASNENQTLHYNRSTSVYCTSSVYAADHRFNIQGNEKVRIDSSGNLLVGKTSTSDGVAGFVYQPARDGAGHPRLTISDDGSTNSYAPLLVYSVGASAARFYVGAGGTVYATSTTITAISDQRLKENIRDLDEGLATVMALKPRKFDWKEGKGANIKNARGFIAQEFETVLPDMIEEWRDPAPEGEEAYKAINANLIPTLVKAIQELKAEFDAYKASHP